MLASAFGMPADQGALPTLYAATEPRARGGQYIGPGGLYEMRGYPKEAVIKKQALDQRARTKLWDAAQKATGVTFLS